MGDRKNPTPVPEFAVKPAPPPPPPAPAVNPFGVNFNVVLQDGDTGKITRPTPPKPEPPELRNMRDGDVPKYPKPFPPPNEHLQRLPYRSPDVGESHAAEDLRITTDGDQYRVEVKRFDWLSLLWPREERWEPILGTETKDLDHARHWRGLYTHDETHKQQKKHWRFVE